jgi:hypothetical protein
MWFTMFVVPREYQEKPKHVQLVWLDLKLVKHWNDVRIEELQGIPLVVGKPNPQVCIVCIIILTANTLINYLDFICQLKNSLRLIFRTKNKL